MCRSLLPDVSVEELGGTTFFRHFLLTTNSLLGMLCS